ncbi:MAG: molybdenum cofactor guanylyltransferase, partial [Pyrinomonadaceae bacterium]
MESIAGFILAGGASSRMGTDKARLTISGKTFVQLIAEEMSHVASRITVVSNDPGLNTGLPTVSDIYERWGALGGVHAGLAACQVPWARVVACDLP